MLFHCQKYSFSKELKTRVINCKPTDLIVKKNGKKETIKCFEVIFEDTVFFPEGGGQPDDHGTVDNVEVLRVIRCKGQAVHYLVDELHVGDEVHQTLDWHRRYDHMQQHSAQHLITAIAEELYGFATTAWALGEKESSIELNTTEISLKQLEEIECVVNDRIQNMTPVNVMEFQVDDPRLEKIRSRGLPEDAGNQVRVVSIEGVDMNMCCGTHVKNLSQLQMIKLLFATKGKTGKTLLHFLAGSRISSAFGGCLSREKRLTSVLHGGPSDHVLLVEKLQKNMKVCQIGYKDALHDIAVFEAKAFLKSKSSIFFHRRQDGDLQYLNTLVMEINDESVLKVLAVGADKEEGILLIHGPQETVNCIGDKVCEILEGKGGGKQFFTGKVKALHKWKEAREFVLTTFNVNQET